MDFRWTTDKKHTLQRVPETLIKELQEAALEDIDTERKTKTVNTPEQNKEWRKKVRNSTPKVRPEPHSKLEELPLQ